MDGHLSLHRTDAPDGAKEPDAARRDPNEHDRNHSDPDNDRGRCGYRQSWQ